MADKPKPRDLDPDLVYRWFGADETVDGWSIVTREDGKPRTMTVVGKGERVLMSRPRR